MSLEAGPASPLSVPDSGGGGPPPGDGGGSPAGSSVDPMPMETDVPASTSSDTTPAVPSSQSMLTSDTGPSNSIEVQQPPKPPPGQKAPQCLPQRAALLKSMLNFLKKAIPDPAFSDSIRHCKLVTE